MLYASQIRAARALLDWKQIDLAKAAEVGLATIQRLEKSNGIVMAHVSTVVQIQAALESAGVQFLPADGQGGVGVRVVRKG